MRVSTLRGVNLFHIVIDHMASVPGLLVVFCSKGCSIQLNDLFQEHGVREKLGEKDYGPDGIVFPVIGAYIDRAKGLKIKVIWPEFIALILILFWEQCHESIAEGGLQKNAKFSQRRFSVKTQGCEHAVVCMHIRSIYSLVPPLGPSDGIYYVAKGFISVGSVAIGTVYHKYESGVPSHV